MRARSAPRSRTTSRFAARMTSCSPTWGRSPAAQRARRWAACASSSRPRPRCGSLRRASRLFQELGAPLFEQVGYLFLADDRAGARRARGAARRSGALGVPVERVDAGFVDGLRTDDVLGAAICREDGIADPSGVTHELVRRATELGVAVREQTDALTLSGGDARDCVRCRLGGSRRGTRRRAARPPARAPTRGRRPSRRRAGRPADDDRGERLPLPAGRHRRAAARDGRTGAALGRA